MIAPHYAKMADRFGSILFVAGMMQGDAREAAHDVLWDCVGAYVDVSVMDDPAFDARAFRNRVRSVRDVRAADYAYRAEVRA